MIYSCDDKAEFSASLSQSSVSLDPLEIIVILSMLKTVVMLNIFMEAIIYIFQDS